jgi:hypothetical protein
MYIKYTEMGVILPHTVADSKGGFGGFKGAWLLREASADHYKRDHLT